MAYLPPSGGRMNMSMAGNMANAATLVSTGTFVLSGGSNVTLSQNGNSINIAAATNGLTSQSNQALSGSNGSFAFQTATFGNSNGLSFYTTNGSMVGSYTVPTQSAQTIGVYATGAQTIGQSSSNTLDARNFNISGQGALSLGMSGSTLQLSVPAQTAQTASLIQALYDGANSISTGTVRVSNANGISFGINGQTLTASHNAITSQTNQNLSLYAVGNTAGQSSSSQLNASNLSLSGLGAVNVGYSAGAAIISAPTQSVQTQQNIQALVGGTVAATASTGTVTFANSNGVSFGLNGNTMTASVAAAGGGGVMVSASNSVFTSGTVQFATAGGAMTIGTAAQQINFSVPAVSSLNAAGIVNISTAGAAITISAPAYSVGMAGNTAGNAGSATNQLILAGGNGVTLSQTTGAGGNTISINAAVEPLLSRHEYPKEVFQSINTIGQGQLSIEHVYLPFYVAASAAKIGGSISVGTSTAAATGSANLSLWMGVYTLTGSTLSLAASGSANNAFSWQAASSASAASLTGVSGMRQLTVPLGYTSATSVTYTATPGEYWIAAAVSSATTATGVTMSLYGNNQVTGGATNAVLTPIGSGTANARDVILFQGIYTATTSAGPASMSGGHINNYSASYVQRANFYHALFNATY